MKVPFSRTDYFPNTVVPFGLEETIEEDCGPGDKQRTGVFFSLSFITPLATFLKRDQELPYV